MAEELSNLDESVTWRQPHTPEIITNNLKARPHRIEILPQLPRKATPRELCRFYTDKKYFVYS